MNRLRAVWSFATGLPSMVWVVLGCAAIGASLTAGGMYAWDARYAAGKRFAADSINVAAQFQVFEFQIKNRELEKKLAAATARTDTVWRAVHARTDTITRVIAAIPEAVRADTNVAQLIVLSERQAGDLARMTQVVLTERAAFTEIHVADSLMINEQAKVNLAHEANERIMQNMIKARVSKPAVVVIATATFSAGVAIGKWVLKGKKRP